jgi:hypothetical protein
MERSLFMSKEKGEELLRALNVILDAITGLNLRDLEDESMADRGKSSSSSRQQPSLQKEKIRLTILTGRTFLSIQFPLLPCPVDLDFFRSLDLLLRRLLTLLVLLLLFRLYWHVVFGV